MKKVIINLNDFNFSRQFFDFDSEDHGQNHTCRVMCLTLALGWESHSFHQMMAAFCAAYVHDMARINDDYCTEHGTWAAEKKVPLFEEQFKKYLSHEYIRSVKNACINHSQNFDLNKNHTDYPVVSLLKDADALDRVRFGKQNLKTKYLRNMHSRSLIGFAEYLFANTKNINKLDFKSVVSFCKLFPDNKISYMFHDLRLTYSL